jgi:hypothetical protein
MNTVEAVVAALDPNGLAKLVASRRRRGRR